MENVRKHFLTLIAEGKLTPAPSIKRARAKLQEQCPEFRGEKYNLRKGKIQDKWRKDLGYEVYKSTKKRIRQIYLEKKI